MLRIGVNELVPATALLLGVAAGYAAGRLLHQAECWALVCLSGLTAVACAGIAWCRQPPIRAERLAAVGLIAYIVAASASEALAFVGDTRELLVSVIWLLPLIVGGELLPRWGAWLSAAGCWVLLVGGVSALAYNVSHVHDGVGFFIRWLD